MKTQIEEARSATNMTEVSELFEGAVRDYRKQNSVILRVHGLADDPEIERVCLLWSEGLNGANPAERTLVSKAPIYNELYHVTGRVMTDPDEVAKYIQDECSDDEESAGECSCKGAVAIRLKADHVGTLADAPSKVEVTGGDTTLDVSWTAPESDGGSTITGYDIRYILDSASETDKADRSKWTDVRDEWELGEALTHQITHTDATKLKNGRKYDVQVRAVNGAGDGPWSPTVVGTPRSVAEAPKNRFSDSAQRGTHSVVERPAFERWLGGNGL